MKHNNTKLTQAIQQALALRKTVGELCMEADPVSVIVVQQCLQPVEGVGMTLVNLQTGLRQRYEQEQEELGS